MMMNSNQPREFLFLNCHVTVEVGKAETPDQVSVLRLRMPFGDAPPLHVHHAEDEIFHILRGEARFQVGDRTFQARRGETVLAPRGIPHGFRITSPDGAEFLTITHGGFETMVRQMARPAEGGDVPDLAVPTHEQQMRLAEACHALGIDLLGPPIA